MTEPSVTEPVSSQTVSAHRGGVLEEGTYGGTKLSWQRSQGLGQMLQAAGELDIILYISFINIFEYLVWLR